MCLIFQSNRKYVMRKLKILHHTEKKIIILGHFNTSKYHNKLRTKLMRTTQNKQCANTNLIILGETIIFIYKK